MSTRAALVNLPNELLFAIVIAGGTASKLGFDGWRESRFPVLLSHVCSRLRATILNMPLAWCLPRLRTGPRCHAPKQLYLFLERSNPCPVDLSLDFGGLTLGTHNDLVDAACACAVKSATRWEHLTIVDEWGTCMPAIFIALGGAHAPRLRTLKLKLAHFPHRLGVPYASFLSDGAPQLRSLELSDVPLPWKSLAGFPRLAALSIYISGLGFEPTLGDLCTVLAALPELRSLSLRAHAGPRLPTPGQDGSFTSRVRIQMPSLVTLELSLVQKHSAVRFLALLCMPALRALTLGNTHDLAPRGSWMTQDDLTYLSGNAHQPLPTVTHLSVTHDAGENADFGFLRTMPGLRRVLCNGSAGGILATLCARTSWCTCPGLWTVALSMANDDSVQHMQASRAAAGFPVEDVEVLSRQKGGIAEGIKAWGRVMDADLADECFH